MATFGENLRAARKQLKMTQHELATAIGCYRSGRMLISLWETNRNWPSRKSLLRLLNFFHSKGIDISFLLTSDEDEVVEKKE